MTILRACPFCGTQPMIVTHPDISVPSVGGMMVNRYTIDCASEECFVKPKTVEMATVEAVSLIWNGKLT